MVRFSLLTLLGVVLVAAVGSAALANPTDTWRRVVVTVVVGVLLVSTLVTLTNRRALPFALGFTVTGWLYLALTVDGILSRPDDLLTEMAIDSLYSLVHGRADPQPPFPSYTGPGAPATPHPDLYYPTPPLSYLTFPAPSANPHNFQTIGHSLWTLILATIGGLFASWIGRRRGVAGP